MIEIYPIKRAAFEAGDIVRPNRSMMGLDVDLYNPGCKISPHVLLDNPNMTIIGKLKYDKIGLVIENSTGDGSFTRVLVESMIGYALSALLEEVE